MRFAGSLLHGCDVSIIVPVYHESPNVLGQLLRRLHWSLRDLRHEIVVVDDSEEPAAAATYAYAYSSASFAESGPAFFLLRGKKMGLGSAVLEGLALADGRYVIVMDGDLQHPPETCRDLVEAAREGGADFVVASRTVVLGRPGYRRLVTRVFNALAYIAVPKARQISDTMSGFFLFEREKAGYLESMEGFKVMLHILARGKFQKVRELSMTFNARAEGKSKASPKEAWLILKQLARLWWDGHSSLRSKPRQRTAIPGQGGRTELHNA